MNNYSVQPIVFPVNNATNQTEPKSYCALFASNVMKAPKKTAKKTARKTTTPRATGDVITLGTKGCGMVLGEVPESIGATGEAVTMVWSGFRANGVTARELCDVHASGKAYGMPFECYDLQCHVSNQGAPVIILPLKTALAKKLVKGVKFDVTPAKGKPFTATGYVPFKWDAATRVPQYIAFQSKDWKAGRIETVKINDATARNAGLIGKVVVAA